jgi:ECF sigma factor
MSRPHFLTVASRAMRQILLDYAKRKRAAKREGARRRVPFEDVEAALKGGGEVSVPFNGGLIRYPEHCWWGSADLIVR